MMDLATPLLEVSRHLGHVVAATTTSTTSPSPAPGAALSSGWADSTAKIISAFGGIVWPVVVVVAAFVFRVPLAGLISKISEINVDGAKILINQQTAAVAAVTKGAVATNAHVDQPAQATPTAAATLTKAATDNPTEAVRASWLAVEEAIKPALANRPGPAPAVPVIMEELAAKGLVLPEVASAAAQMAQMRSQADQRHTIFTVDSALNFSAAASDLVTLLNAVATQPGTKPSRTTGPRGRGNVIG